MNWNVQAHIHFLNQNQRDVAVTQSQAQLDRFQLAPGSFVRAKPPRGPGSNPAHFDLVLDARFPNQAGAQEVLSAIQTIYDARGAQAGSRLEWHQCAHDEQAVPCVSTHVKDW